MHSVMAHKMTLTRFFRLFDDEARDIGGTDLNTEKSIPSYERLSGTSLKGWK